MDYNWLIAGAAAVLIAVVFLVWQTKTKGLFGLDLSRKKCPRCGTPLPMIRKPSSTEEALWGGWTCPKCGAKIDKYGRERAAS